MKRLTVLLAVLCLVIMPLSAQDSPLDIPVTLDMDNVTLEEVIDAMMGQTGVMFLYKSTDLGASGKVSVHVTAAPIRQVLRQLNVDARVEGRNLILMRRDALQLHDNRNPSLPVKSRMRMAGRVVDGNGEPLVGATVMIHGTSEGTTTDLDGNYSMSVADGDWVDALLIGYKTVSRKAASRLDFVLEDDITQLEEVVVVGYGVQKKVNLTGSVESLGGEAMENLPMPSLSIIKGDAKSASIAAASILAKVTRDRLMMQYDAEYPQYGFAQHKGYGTAQHIAALRKYGPCPIHRRSFEPVRSMAGLA